MTESKNVRTCKQSVEGAVADTSTNVHHKDRDIR